MRFFFRTIEFQSFFSALDKSLCTRLVYARQAVKLPPMPVLPFSTDAEVVGFAKAFLQEHLERFRKDIKICLTPDENKAHAYFPALMSCISFADLLSGLYAGKLEGQALKELKNYASKFMGAEYTADRVDVLYQCFRHKVAHLAQPYAVFDTQSKPNTFGGGGVDV